MTTKTKSPLALLGTPLAFGKTPAWAQDQTPSKRQFVATPLAGVLILTSAYAQNPTTAVPELHHGLLTGYLPKEAVPDSLALLPSPPAQDSAAFALDMDVARKSTDLRGTPRWTQAAVDPDLSFPNAASIFSCVLNAPITEKATPRLYLLLRRTLTDAGLSTYVAKNHHQRTRPFVVNKEPVCAPSELADLEKDGSPAGKAPSAPHSPAR